MLGYVQHVGIYSIRGPYRGISTCICTSRHGKGKWKSTTQRPTNLKWGRSERVSWGEAEEKSTVTVTLLQRRDKGQTTLEDNTFLTDTYIYRQTYASVEFDNIS